MCEGRTHDTALPAGKYRLRLTSNTPELLVPVRDVSTIGVEMHEVKEYFVPERHNVMFRYVVNVGCDTPATVQVGTSKPDVNFRLEVYREHLTSSFVLLHVFISLFPPR